MIRRASGCVKVKLIISAIKNLNKSILSWPVFERTQLSRLQAEASTPLTVLTLKGKRMEASCCKNYSVSANGRRGPPFPDSFKQTQVFALGCNFVMDCPSRHKCIFKIRKARMDLLCVQDIRDNYYMERGANWANTHGQGSPLQSTCYRTAYQTVSSFHIKNSSRSLHDDWDAVSSFFPYVNQICFWVRQTDRPQVYIAIRSSDKIFAEATSSRSPHCHLCCAGPILSSTVFRISGIPWTNKSSSITQQMKLYLKSYQVFKKIWELQKHNNNINAEAKWGPQPQLKQGPWYL